MKAIVKHIYTQNNVGPYILLGCWHRFERVKLIFWFWDIQDKWKTIVYPNKIHALLLISGAKCIYILFILFCLHLSIFLLSFENKYNVWW